MQRARETAKSQVAIGETLSSKEITIREAKASDAKAIAEIEKQCFSMPWSEAEILREIEQNEPAHYFVADNKSIVGYVGVWYIAGEGHITNVAVAEEHRRCGIADMLIEALIKNSEARAVEALTLEVRKSNLPAQKLYKKHGFACEGVRKNYYDGKEDAIIMWRRVKV